MNLKDAEHELLQTVAEDPDFDLAYYNLGVVYTELDLLDAAGVAFDKAITINNRRWSAYYALGRNRYTRGLNIGLDNLDMLPALDRIRVMTEASQHYLKAIDHCERACRLAPSLFIKAQALNLKALCYLRQGDTDIYQAARTARKAYIAAWWALCLYESRRTANTVEQKILHEQTYSFVSLCLWNLSQYVVFDINNQKTAALPRSEDGNPDLPAIANIPVTNTWLQKIVLRKTIKYLIMARMLTPWVADIHRNLGLIYLQYGKYRHAIHALYTCARVDPSSAIPWGYLAFAYSQYNNQRAVFNTFYRVLDNFDPAFPDSLEYSLRGLARLYVANDQLHEFLRQMEAKKARRPSSLGRLLLVFSFLPRFLIVAYRMGGYSWMELGRQSQILKAYMLDRTQAENAHEANRNILQVIANRIDRLFGFDREISKLIDQKDIAELEKKLQEEVTLGFDWECGTIEVALAQYYYQNDDNEKAIEHIDAAIGYFRHLHPDEIQRRGLYSYKSRMQQSNRQYGEALDSAKVGIGKQPIGSYERNALGWAYFNLSDFAEAEKAWLDALYWEPNNPEIHYNLGLAYYYQSLDTHIKDARKELLNKATQYFNDAYELYSPGDSRIRARYLLAKCYFYAAHYTHALIELRALEKLEQYHEVVSLELADSLLSRGDFKEAEYWFVSISEKLAAKLADANGDVNQRIVSLPLSGVQNLGVALCYAHLGIASTLLDRDIQLSIANAEIDKAYTFLENLANKDEQSFWRSRCDIFKSKVEMKQGQPEQAIEKLEAAIAADDDANTYYLLASALEQIIQKATSDQEKTLLIARFRNYCTQAQKKDWNDELKTELEQLQQKLSA
ncbi:MAG: tetratricopeptide repeat protein [Gammaproteobacteria bacterium]|nr:tetratricopeptide repeat protein [Gammaproteobacteria bacterium]